jgi:hypothetical protein
MTVAAIEPGETERANGDGFGSGDSVGAVCECRIGAAGGDERSAVGSVIEFAGGRGPPEVFDGSNVIMTVRAVVWRSCCGSPSAHFSRRTMPDAHVGGIAGDLGGWRDETPQPWTCCHQPISYLALLLQLEHPGEDVPCAEPVMRQRPRLRGCHDVTMA